MTPAKLRKLVGARDGGKCHYCGVDCAAIEAGYYDALAIAENRHAHVMRRCFIGNRVATSARQLDSERKTIRGRLERMGFKVGRKLWEAHHVVGLEEGGTNDLANVVTACFVCHSRLSKEQAGRKARRLKKRLARLGEDRQGRAVWR